jgi:hypothetical protein
MSAIIRLCRSFRSLSGLATLVALGVLAAPAAPRADVPCPGTIGDIVWHDLNRNGLQDPGEPGLDGVLVTLKIGSTVITTTTTGVGPGGQHGYYQFTGLCPAAYKVEVATPAGFTPATSPAGADATLDSNPSPASVSLTTTKPSDQTIDFGFVTTCTGSIGNFVWHDVNRDGIQDLIDEPGLDGVEVTLRAVGGGVLATTTTGAGPGGQHGYYQFTGLCEGSYQVEVAAPAGFVSTASNAPDSAPATDSNPSPAEVTLSGDGASDQTIDFGFITECSGTIGDFVWHDLDYDGIQDPGEPGIDGATVRLTNADGTAVIATMTTAVGPGGQHGYYQFGGLCGGSYRVDVDTPSGLRPTTPTSGGSTSANDSNLSPAPVVLSGDSDSNDTIDFGFVAPCAASIGDFVWEDLDADGIQDPGEPGINGATVKLHRASDYVVIATTYTDKGGNPERGGYYQFTGLCPGEYKVELVPLSAFALSPEGQGSSAATDSNANPSLVALAADNASDQTIDFGIYPLGRLGDRVWNDVDGDGVQDAGEPGLEGWTVNITGPGGDVTSMTTGADGIYTFDNLPAGSYRVCVDAKSGYTQTYDLDGVLATPGCATRVLGIGENTDIVDFGYRLVPLTNIGDFVWHDVNKNGKQDNGEPGLAGSTVTLFGCGPDGQAGTADDGDPLMAQTTSPSGAYLFSNLLAGCYYVRFSTPAGYTPTTPNVAGVDDSENSDAVAGVTKPYTLAPGVPNLTVDAGFYLAPPGLEIMKTADKPFIAPYDPVTYSYTVTNTGGTTLTNIKVTDDNGTPSFVGDDFTVCTIASLAPGAFDDTTCTATVIPVVSTESVVNGATVPAGAVIVVTNLAAGVSPCPAGSVGGCVKVTYLQDFGINDNTYGTGAIGWPGNNKTFSQLVGSDKLEFRFFAKNGSVAIDFYIDTISAASSVTVPGTGQVIAYPSGYGTLGPFGGDGSMVAGDPGSIVTFSTSMTENLNDPLNVPKKATLIVNSPTSLVAGNVVVNTTAAPGGWNHINNYSVVVKASAFSAGGGFLSVAVPDQHNSPNKLGGPNGMSTVAKSSTVVNTAKAATASGGGLTATATASVNIVVPPAPCSLAMTAMKLDKNTFTATITNNGTADAVFTRFQMTWPGANGKLTQINLDADVVYTTPDISGGTADLTTALVAAPVAKRTIQAGTSDVFKVTFEKNVDKTLSHYTGSFTFGGCTLPLR